MKIGIREAAKILGVRKETLRRWEREGKIQSERTPGGHRRYEASLLPHGHGVRKLDTSNKRTVCYGRVSSSDQKEDLVRQMRLLESYCTAQGWKYELIQDLGSGLNYGKRGLKSLIHQICSGKVDRLVVTHKDRLLRFGSELIFSLCSFYETEVVILNAGQDLSFEEELAQDVLEIITVFSARLYGARSHKNKNLLKNLKEAADAVCS
jgi:putative resolvase